MILRPLRPDYSQKTARLASCLLLFFACFAPQALYAVGEFSVDKVMVDASGSDTTDARSKALAQGQTEAFKQLLQKKKPVQATEILAKTTAAQIDAMVRGYQVLDEKMTANHYHATV